jgi:hypothetical protein
MGIIRQLTNEESIDLMSEGEQQALRSTLEALPGAAREAAFRSEKFWETQRSMVWSQISNPRLLHERNTANRMHRQGARRTCGLVVAGMAAMFLLGALLLDHGALAPPRSIQADPDHELLLAVERAVHNDGPAALDPAALLADEMVQEISVARSPIRKKEPVHEN